MPTTECLRVEDDGLGSVGSLSLALEEPAHSRPDRSQQAQFGDDGRLARHRGSPVRRLHQVEEVRRQFSEGDAISLDPNPKLWSRGEDDIMASASQADSERENRLHVTPRAERLDRDPHS